MFVSLHLVDQIQFVAPLMIPRRVPVFQNLLAHHQTVDQNVSVTQNVLTI